MISLKNSLILSYSLFCLGFACVTFRKNLLFILIGIEIMLNASMLVLVVAGSYHQKLETYVLYIFAISVAAIEASVGLVLLVKCYRTFGTLNIDNLILLKK